MIVSFRGTKVYITLKTADDICRLKNVIDELPLDKDVIIHKISI